MACVCQPLWPLYFYVDSVRINAGVQLRHNVRVRIGKNTPPANRDASGLLSLDSYCQVVKSLDTMAVPAAARLRAGVKHEEQGVDEGKARTSAIDDYRKRLKP